MLITMTRTMQSALVNLPDRARVLPLLGQAFHELGDFGAEPSMVFAGPDYTQRELDDDGRHNLWRLVRMALRSGGRCYLELSVDKAERSPGRPTPTSVSAELIEQEVRARGGYVERSEEGREPMTHRMVARWGA